MQAYPAPAKKRTAAPHSVRLDRRKSCFRKPAPAAEIFFASHGGKLMQAYPAPAKKRTAAPHSARLDSRKSRFCKPASHKKSQGACLGFFFFYKARPLRRQKYSPLRMAENSCRLNPASAEKRSAALTRRSSTAAKAALASPLRTKKSQGGKRLDFFYKLIRICPNRGNP